MDTKHTKSQTRIKLVVAEDASGWAMEIAPPRRMEDEPTVRVDVPSNAALVFGAKAAA